MISSGGRLGGVKEVKFNFRVEDTALDFHEQLKTYFCELLSGMGNVRAAVDRSLQVPDAVLAERGAVQTDAAAVQRNSARAAGASARRVAGSGLAVDKSCTAAGVRRARQLCIETRPNPADTPRYVRRGAGRVSDDVPDRAGARCARPAPAVRLAENCR